jgi:CHASE3 domain sensor protein
MEKYELKDVSEAEMNEKIDEIRQHTATDPKLQKVIQYTPCQGGRRSSGPS